MQLLSDLYSCEDLLDDLRPHGRCGGPDTVIAFAAQGHHPWL